jgi:hypothetical protein
MVQCLLSEALSFLHHWGSATRTDSGPGRPCIMYQHNNASLVLLVPREALRDGLSRGKEKKPVSSPVQRAPASLVKSAVTLILAQVDRLHMTLRLSQFGGIATWDDPLATPPPCSVLPPPHLLLSGSFCKARFLQNTMKGSSICALVFLTFLPVTSCSSVRTGTHAYRQGVRASCSWYWYERQEEGS